MVGATVTILLLTIYFAIVYYYVARVKDFRLLDGVGLTFFTVIGLMVLGPLIIFTGSVLIYIISFHRSVGRYLPHLWMFGGISVFFYVIYVALIYQLYPDYLGQLYLLSLACFAVTLFVSFLYTLVDSYSLKKKGGLFLFMIPLLPILAIMMLIPGISESVSPDASFLYKLVYYSLRVVVWSVLIAIIVDVVVVRILQKNPSVTFQSAISKIVMEIGYLFIRIIDAVVNVFISIKSRFIKLSPSDQLTISLFAIPLLAIMIIPLIFYIPIVIVLEDVGGYFNFVLSFWGFRESVGYGIIELVERLRKLFGGS